VGGRTVNELARCECGNDFKGDNLCMPSGCQMEDWCEKHLDYHHTCPGDRYRQTFGDEDNEETKR
jgi:hypothetical protein